MRSNIKDSDLSAPHPLKACEDEEPRLSCFGDPQKVSQQTPEGLIEPNVECVNCEWVSSCLKKALQKKGILHTPLYEKEPVKRAIGFLRRWSEKKLGSR